MHNITGENDPLAHCMRQVGLDVKQRPLIYSKPYRVIVLSSHPHDNNPS